MALRNQSAQDIGRYDFIKDNERVEYIVAERAPNATGYAILLTNYHFYWTQSLSDDTADVKFRLHEGGKLYGALEWGLGASPGIKRGREQPLQLAKSHALRWRDFSHPAHGSYATFRYLVARVDNTGSTPVLNTPDAGTNLSSNATYTLVRRFRHTPLTTASTCSQASQSIGTSR